MTELSSQVAALERKASQSSARLEDTIEQIMLLEKDAIAFEQGELSAASLARAVKRLADQYRSSSKAFLAKLAADGFQEAPLTKYTDSTYFGERILTVKIMRTGQVFINTASGQHFLGTFSEGYDYSQSPDYILCGFSEHEFLDLRK